jgi:hypothetical protein
LCEDINVLLCGMHDTRCSADEQFVEVLNCDRERINKKDTTTGGYLYQSKLRKISLFSMELCIKKILMMTLYESDAFFQIGIIVDPRKREINLECHP